MLELFRDSPTEITIILTVLVAAVTFWLKNKEVDVSSATVIARLQMEQMTSILEQNVKLSNDIAELRKLTSEQFEVIKELRLRIYELESNHWDRRIRGRDDHEIEIL